MSLAFHPDALDEYLAAIRAHDEAGAFVEAVARCVSQAARWRVVTDEAPRAHGTADLG